MTNGRGYGRSGPKKRSAIARENAISNESQKNKAKKGINDSSASDSSKKSQSVLSGKSDLEKIPATHDETMTPSDTDGNLKTTGLDTSPIIPTNVVPQSEILDQNTASLNENDGNESEGTDTTPKRSSSYITRISVNFFVPPSENEADKKLFSAASKWMAKMEESDNKITLLPWYDSDMSEQPIRSFKDIPSALFMFKKYFTRANPNEKGGKIYTDLKLSHSKPLIEIKGDISWWLKKEQTDVFIKDIQSETTVRCGWLLFSYSGLDVKALTDEISLFCGVTVAGRYKPVLSD